MNAEQWAFKCAQQLHQQWPGVDHNDLEHLAQALWREARWQGMEPTQAAIAWLGQGIPASGQSACGEARVRP